MDKIAFLRSISLFAGLDESVVEELSQHVFEKQLKRGDVVINEGGRATALYFVGEGAMKVYRTSPEGKEQAFGIIRPRDFFNETLLDNGPAKATAEALGIVLLYGIQKANLRSMVRQYPKMAGNMINILSRRVHSLVLLVEDLSFRAVSSRVAKILVENAQGADGARLTHRDMAAIAGTAREVVSRSLGYLDDCGFIELRRHQIVVKDINGLKELADLNL